MNDRSSGVVVIVLDSLRADHVSQGTRSLTPFLDELSARGVVFERAVAPAAWTLPSHVSMLTGLSPTEHRIQSCGGVRPTLSAARDRITRLVGEGRYLPTWLAGQGVDTFLGSSIGWLSQASGFGQGFGKIAYVPFPPGGKPDSRGPSQKVSPAALQRRARELPVPVKHLGKMGLETLAEVRRAIPISKWVASRQDKGASRIEAAFADWIAKVEGPFFALINLIETHDPHIAPKGLGTRDLRSVVATIGGKTFTRRMNLHNWGYRSLPSGEIDRLMRAYRAETNYADLCVRRIVSHLTRAGLEKDTTIIVTADHGESFGEHGLVGHGIPLTQSVLHVPLIVAGPSAPQEKVSSVVGLGALAGSVAATMTGGPGPFGPPSFIAQEGRGIARCEVEAPGRYFHTSGLKIRQISDEMDRPAAAFYQGAFKLIVGSFWGEALYDLDSDPTESTNLIGQRPIPGPIAEMRALWEQRCAPK